tara:strand:- start:880 stop:1116 length:237 start_codon:yes stop_codon:yes gene_type:complete
MNDICECPYCAKEFKSWQGVAVHTGKCKLSDKTYAISQIYGPIHICNLHYKSRAEIFEKYPKLTVDSLRGFFKTIPEF